VRVSFAPFAAIPLVVGLSLVPLAGVGVSRHSDGSHADRQPAELSAGVCGRTDRTSARNSPQAQAAVSKIADGSPARIRAYVERAKGRPASVIPIDCDAELKRRPDALAKARTQ
jgi:hypothetical protein